jgi:antibiotic biosynthesis monooxygenase
MSHVGFNAPGVIKVPWYATVFRGDEFAAAVSQLAPIALRYGARDYTVHRDRDDRYRITQYAYFDSLEAWERYWNGPEFTDFRMVYSSFYQVPLLPSWLELVAHGQTKAEPIIRPEPIEQG